jgi:hypothetical protein
MRAKLLGWRYIGVSLRVCTYIYMKIRYADNSYTDVPSLLSSRFYGDTG